MLFSSQPFKGLYALYSILATLARLPMIISISLFPSLRPHRRWTFLQTLMNRLLQEFLYHSAKLRTKTPQNLDPGSWKEKYVTIPPGNLSLYTGIMTSDPNIKPAKIGAAWYGDMKSNGDVVLHFHGGGFVIGDARDDAKYAGELMAKYIAPRTLLPDYRLASNPLGHFPAPIQDSVSAYEYLLSSGIPAQKIIVSGDSAGASMAIALLRYISDKHLLPAPKAALLWSPPTDIGAVLEKTREMATDYLDDEFLHWSLDAYTESGKHDIKQPYVTPLGNPFKSETPMWVHVGGVERFCDTAVKWVKEMREVEGNVVELWVEELGNHDLMYVGSLNGFKKEAEKAVKIARKFVDGI